MESPEAGGHMGAGDGAGGTLERRRDDAAAQQRGQRAHELRAATGKAQIRAGRSEVARGGSSTVAGGEEEELAAAGLHGEEEKERRWGIARG